MATQTMYMLTTVDNPFDPFDQYDEWYAYDSKAGHHTPGLLARICVTSPEMSEADQSVAIRDAVNEIVYENVSGLHKKVVREIEVEDSVI